MTKRLCALTVWHKAKDTCETEQPELFFCIHCSTYSSLFSLQYLVDNMTVSHFTNMRVPVLLIVSHFDIRQGPYVDA